MCTVTLVPLNSSEGSFVLTSNRDEAVERKAIPPEIYKEQEVKLLYPKDRESGGSWIGLSENKRLICLLNGGFESHKRKDSYRLSRGVVLKDLLIAEDANSSILKYNFKNIEPFTIIMVDWRESLRFLELVWDGEQKHIKELSLKNHLWSSSPLYNLEMRRLRENWFESFRQKNTLSAEAIWNFHHTGGNGEKETDIIMDRGFVKTQSITQVLKTENTVKMIYEDLSTQEITTKNFFMQ